jgi:protein TonB
VSDTAAGRRLAISCGVSLLLHALAGVAATLWRSPPAKPPALPPPLEARLQPPQPAPAPRLIAPETPADDAASAAATPPPPRPAARPPKPPPPPTRLDPVAAATREIARHLLYPPAAIAQGLQGEALVRLFLDEHGNALAARLERSSGHALLDDAAVAAARAVRAVPDGAPAEVLLPVRFRLN